MRLAGILKELGDGFTRSYGVGGEDVRNAMHRGRELQGKTQEAPKIDMMAGSYPLGQKARELIGQADPDALQARKEMNMHLQRDASPATQIGDLAGTVAADLTQDTSRRFYWLLNALQATGEVINEKTLAAANQMAVKAGKSKDLFGKSDVVNQLSGEVLRPSAKSQALEQGAARMQDGKLTPNRGYSIVGSGDDAKFVKRNFEPGFVQSLAIPTGIAINSGLGLLTPFGGAEGYKAAAPSEEDPTKTNNVLTEVGLKYVMGRTGNLLPYNEFVKVRPDVSKDEYGRYQAFKYDNDTDLNLLDDGQVSLPGGAVKYTNEGIHGAELQFLGRSLPVTTGVVPFLGALAGGAAGVTRPRPVRGGFVGGMAGLAAGQIAGNVLEQERRRRNAAANGQDAIDKGIQNGTILT